MRVRWLGSLLVGLLWPGVSAAQVRDTARPAPTTLEELQSRIREVLDSTHTPGIGLALVTRDSVLYVGGMGLADVAAKRNSTARTLFRIGSTSKAFAALSVLLMQEEGKLQLGDPIRQHLPDLYFKNPWESSDPIRIVNLLEHTTGFDDNSFKGYANNDPTPLTLRQGLDLDSATHVSRWRPGTRVSYCNTGPAIAAYIVERLAGLPFEQVVQSRLFNPLGMTTATYFFPDTARLPVATLYQRDGKTPFPYWHVFIRPAGSINASAEDMAAYVRFLLNRGAVAGVQVVPSMMIDRLERSEASLEASAGLTVGYGLHIARYADSTGFIWTGHDGGVAGGLTNMAYIPALGIGYAFMINSSNGDSYAQISRLVRDFLTRDAPHPALPALGPMPTIARTRYAGWYRPDNPRVQHIYFLERLFGLTQVEVNDTALVLRPFFGGSPLTYIPVEGMRFRERREPVATLALVADSADERPMAIEAMGYLLPTSLVRVPAITAYLEIGLTVLWLLGVAITMLVAFIGVLRGLVRLVRRRQATPTVTRPMWRTAIATLLSLAIGIGVPVLRTAGNDLSLGKASIYSVGPWLVLMLFAVLAGWSLVNAFRRISPDATPNRVSLVVVRTVALLNVVAAGYLIHWGLIGWRTWA